MMWVISLLLLAVAAYFLISALNSKNKFDTDTQASDGEVIDSESAQLASDASSSEALQHAGGAPAGLGSGSGSSSASSNASLSGRPASSASTGSISSSSTSTGGVVAGAAAVGVSATAAIDSAREHNLKNVTGNGIGDIQEMLKILNLRDSDSSRLAIEKDQFAGLKSGSSNLDANELTAIADKLRWMLR